MATRTTLPGTADPGEVATSAFANSLPGGWLGWTTVTASQTGITTETALTGLTLTVTVQANRVLKVTAHLNLVLSSGTGANVVVAIKEGATYLSAVQEVRDLNNGVFAVTITAVVTPTAGAHTYYVSLSRTTASTTTVGTNAGATIPAVLVVEDIGST